MTGSRESVRELLGLLASGVLFSQCIAAKPGDGNADAIDILVSATGIGDSLEQAIEDAHRAAMLGALGGFADDDRKLRADAFRQDSVVVPAGIISKSELISWGRQSDGTIKASVKVTLRPNR